MLHQPTDGLGPLAIHQSHDRGAEFQQTAIDLDIAWYVSEIETYQKALVGSPEDQITRAMRSILQLHKRALSDLRSVRGQLTGQTYLKIKT